MKGRTLGMVTAGVALAIGGASYLAFLLKEDMGEDLTKQLEINQKLNAPVPLDAQVINEEGETVKLGSLFKGRPVILMPIFYNCKSACAVEFESALKAFREMKTDQIGETFDVVTLSIHPKETPELAVAKKNEYLKRYLSSRAPIPNDKDKAKDEARKKVVADNWHFLTGETEEVKKITDAVGFKYTYNEEKDRVIHPAAIMIVTPNGRVSRYLIGTTYPQPFTRNALLDAGQEVIGQQAQSVTFFGCFTYDPTTGKTMLHVKGAIQLLGAITLLTLVLSIISMNRRYKEEHANKEDSGDA